MGYSSTAEQRAVNSKVPGSNPGIPARRCRPNFELWFDRSIPLKPLAEAEIEGNTKT